MTCLKYLLLILNILFSSLVSAQGYQLLNLAKVPLYIDSTGDLIPIKIDSIHVSGTDSIFYPYKMFDRHKGFGSGGSSNPCQTVKDTNWIGQKAIKQNNGTYLFYNKRNESIIIKSKAEINSTWNCFVYNNGDYISAQVKSIAYDNVLTSMDSIKTITLTKFNSYGTIQNSPINNVVLKISKKYGFISLPELSYFPYQIYQLNFAGIDKGNFGLTLFNDSESYDFNVGDVFEYDSSRATTSTYFTQHSKVIITDKKATPDSVVYKKTIYLVTRNGFSISIDTVHSTFVIYPNRSTHFRYPYYISTNSSNEIYYIRYRKDTTFNGTVKKNCHILSGEIQNDSCFYGFNPWNGHYWIEKSFTFSPGLGKTFYYYHQTDGMPYTSQYMSLRYFQKGNDYWGKEQNVCDLLMLTTKPSLWYYLNYLQPQIISYDFRYEWYKDGLKLQLPDTTWGIYHPDSGCYQLRVTYGNCISEVSEIYSNNNFNCPATLVTFVKNTDTPRVIFKIYPNPCKDEFTLELNDKGYKYILFSSSGIKIDEGNLEKGLTQIKFKNYSPGLYFINLFNAENNLSQKIVLE